ncbi:MAG: family 20 glycosylhydrolase, partial [Cyclobacteriaceae bacterium]
MLKKILWILFVVVILLIAGGYLYYRIVLYNPPPISAEDRQSIDLMPLPSSLELTGGRLVIQSIHVNQQNSPVQEGVERLLHAWHVTSEDNGVPLTIRYDTLIHTPFLHMNEAYALQVSSDGVLLTAPTSVGVLRGLESLRQLAERRDGELLLPHLEVSDKPRYPWRTGSKGDYYTQEDIREIVSYAASHGIRVVPEFDMPGHSKSWQIAYPELSSAEGELRFGKQGGSIFGPPLDPTKEYTYVFIDSLVSEMSTLFPDTYFHIGGDEVNPEYWEENSRIRDAMDSLGVAGPRELQALFNSRIHSIVKRYGKSMVGWDEIIHEGLSDDV